jgi:hypothetical protein
MVRLKIQLLTFWCKSTSLNFKGLPAKTWLMIQLAYQKISMIILLQDFITRLLESASCLPRLQSSSSSPFDVFLKRFRNGDSGRVYARYDVHTRRDFEICFHAPGADSRAEAEKAPLTGNMCDAPPLKISSHNGTLI